PSTRGTASSFGHRKSAPHVLAGCFLHVRTVSAAGCPKTPSGWRNQAWRNYVSRSEPVVSRRLDPELESGLRTEQFGKPLDATLHRTLAHAELVRDRLVRQPRSEQLEQ